MSALDAVILDPASPLPRWAQLAADLRRRLAAEEFPLRFPSEPELVDEYSVSRATVRQAVGRLEDEGLVERRQGAGTFVADPVRLGETWGVASLALTLTALGVTESSVVRSSGIEAAGSRGVGLGLEATEQVVAIERLRLGDGDPLAIDRSWLPAEVARPLLATDLTSGSLYAALASTCGIRVTGGKEEIRPARPTTSDRRVLRLPGDEMVFIRTRVAMAGTDPVEIRSSVLRGDRYGLIATWGRQD